MVRSVIKQARFAMALLINDVCLLEISVAPWFSCKAKGMAKLIVSSHEVVRTSRDDVTIPDSPSGKMLFEGSEQHHKDKYFESSCDLRVLLSFQHQHLEARRHLNSLARDNCYFDPHKTPIH